MQAFERRLIREQPDVLKGDAHIRRSGVEKQEGYRNKGAVPGGRRDREHRHRIDEHEHEQRGNDHHRHDRGNIRERLFQNGGAQRKHADVRRTRQQQEKIENNANRHLGAPDFSHAYIVAKNTYIRQRTTKKLIKKFLLCAPSAHKKATIPPRSFSSLPPAQPAVFLNEKAGRTNRPPRLFGGCAPPLRRDGMSYSISMTCSSFARAGSLGMNTLRMPFSYFALISSLLISPT